MTELETSDGTRLYVTDEGEGRPVVLLHGLTSTNRYVLMGSRIVQKRGCRVVGYDARGHGSSDSADDRDSYGYSSLASDLSQVIHELGLERPIGVGISMGAHTLASLAANDADAFAGLLLITPAYLPGMELDAPAAARWHALADGLRSGGPQGFLDAGAVGNVDGRWQELAARATLQRMQLHSHPEAVADALEVVPGSRPFDDWSQFAGLNIPITVVGSRDEADPGHPLEVAAVWAEMLPGARLVVEEPGESPLAWRGASLSKLVLELLDAQDTRQSSAT